MGKYVFIKLFDLGPIVFEFFTFLDNVVDNLWSTIVLGFLPSECDGILLQVDDFELLGSFWYSYKNEDLYHN